ncbi:MAG TPA: serine--tRNA ligase [Thermoplasmata archaeon]|nr:serine--tRNA ligase [Thermoplasmata archaeon]
MLDIRLVRENPDLIRTDLAKRGDPARAKLLDEVIRADREYRDDLAKLEALRKRRNEITRDVAAAKKAKRDAAKLMKEAADLPNQIKALEGRIEELNAKVRDGLLRLPNLLHETVPLGKDETQNVEVARWGTPKAVDFELRPHSELVEATGAADFERARKIAGAGFVYLMGDLVRLDQALLAFSLDYMVKQGFTPVFPPYMMRRAAYEGVTDLGDFENVMYKIEGEDLYLIATSEHPMGAMFMDEILDEARLPLLLTGTSACFRREIGGHGVDTKGLFRMHQFNKVEQFVFCRPEDSWTWHEKLRANGEAIYRALEIPYRVVNVCTGDIGTVAAKKYDIEAWFPRQKQYREVISCSNCTDYQARRLNTRAGKVGGEKFVPHTLNATAMATSRGLVAVLENYQNADGTVTVPKVLRPFMGGQERLRDSSPRSESGALRPILPS